MLVKMILAFGIGLGLALLLYPLAIPYLHKIKFGQSIRQEGPKSHLIKAGTPTMGGVVFIITSIVTALIVIPKAFSDKTFLLVLFSLEKVLKRSNMNIPLFYLATPNIFLIFPKKLFSCSTSIIGILFPSILWAIFL